MTNASVIAMMADDRTKELLGSATGRPRDGRGRRLLASRRSRAARRLLRQGTGRR